MGDETLSLSYLGHPTRPCMCGESEIIKYRSRLSGPLADRIDMQVTLTPVPLVNLDANVTAESSTVIRSRVDAARALQRFRYAATTGVTCNAHASGRWLLTRGGLAAEARRLLVEGAESLHLSARAYHRVLRVARTIADLSQSEAVTSEHVGEALRYRATLASSAYPTHLPFSRPTQQHAAVVVRWADPSRVSLGPA